ncbi:MAG: alpha/beta fold hydrolase [Desulfobacterales bacterium]|nr:alpha/beta fold hydrolase [Desulfobacterales bacterium]MDD4072039.1 alpha/beta fold hydrolase [Desulfobacterales bacterium]MDD4394013.1 alpha/beta fold hydrolase [Desulfobacterales bacterium]
MKTTCVFIHGLDSSSHGTKGVYFKRRFPEMLVTDYRGCLEDRMHTLNLQLEDKTGLILIGSSFGGLMAAIYACNNVQKVKKLVLLAPALDHEGFAPCLNTVIDIPVIVYHGSLDDVVPAEPVHSALIRVFSHISYHLVEDDHPLHRTFTSLDWNALLGPRQ